MDLNIFDHKFINPAFAKRNDAFQLIFCFDILNDQFWEIDFN